MNTKYLKIKEHGYDIEVRSNSEGWARAYLLKGGKRTGDYVHFRDNNQSTSKMNEQLQNARPSTHLGRAIAGLYEIAPLVKMNNKLDVSLSHGAEEARTKI